MEQQDLRTLKLLEAIESGQFTSQRDLAQELNVSLGLVNSFIKRLVRKGYFKVTNIPRNRVRYLLTPKGAAEKTRLTYTYIHYSFLFYKKARQNLRELCQTLSSQKAQRIVLFGSGDLAEIAFLSLQEFALDIVAVIDNENKGKAFAGTEIKAASELPNLTYDCILVTTPNDGSIKQLGDFAIPRSKIFFIVDYGTKIKEISA